MVFQSLGLALLALVLLRSTVPISGQQPVYVQQGPKVVGSGFIGQPQFGASVALSSDGNTALVGASNDRLSLGSILVFARDTNSGFWSQQGSPLKGTNPSGQYGSSMGSSMAISSNGNTVVVGGENDNDLLGAVWIFVRSNGAWSQQGPKLVGTGNSGTAQQGGSVAISSDGNTVAVGGEGDASGIGAVWVFTRSNGVWSQQGSKLVGSGGAGSPALGSSVAVSGDGNTLLAGGMRDGGSAGAVWVFGRVNGVWSQEGSKLTPSDSLGGPSFGAAVAIAANGNTAVIGGFSDGSGGRSGAVWQFVRTNGAWTQQGPKLVGTGFTSGTSVYQGRAVAISADGNTTFVGGFLDDDEAGASWVFVRDVDGIWTQQGSKLQGTDKVGLPLEGLAVALSSGGNTAMTCGTRDNRNVGACWVYVRVNGVWSQQGPKLVGAGFVGGSQMGFSLAVSSDGRTALCGGPGDGGNVGATWVSVRDVTGAWTQQGSKLVGTGYVFGVFGTPSQGGAVALSGDGNTALVGGSGDASVIGAAWVFTRDSAGAWSQQGSKLVGTGVGGVFSGQGADVALSLDGNTALLGGSVDNAAAGAVWVFSRSSVGVWSQQGAKIVGSGALGTTSQQGASVALSADGNTAVWGGPGDDGNAGAVWVFVRTNGQTWSQQGAKLVGSGASGKAKQGSSIALSSDGNTVLFGGIEHDYALGAVWVFVRSSGGTWTQQGPKLTGSDATTPLAFFGKSVALSAHGNVAVVGGYFDSTEVGAVWMFTRSANGVWTELGSKLVGSGYLDKPQQGISVALSSTGETLLVGGPNDDRGTGAFWTFGPSRGSADRAQVALASMGVVLFSLLL